MDFFLYADIEQDEIKIHFLVITWNCTLKVFGNDCWSMISSLVHKMILMSLKNGTNLELVIIMGKGIHVAFILIFFPNIFSGMLLTLSIALFHGKCHILRKSELLGGYLIPYKKVINESRTYSFGWSFVLAWICVFLCFTSSFVWLYKAQDPQNSRKPGTQYYVKHRTHRGIEYMSYLQNDDDT